MKEREREQHVCVQMCVCLKEREKERERERKGVKELVCECENDHFTNCLSMDQAKEARKTTIGCLYNDTKAHLLLFI